MKENKFITLGADIGSGFLKLSTNEFQKSFRSHVGETPQTEEFGLDQTRQIKFMGKSFIVDKDAYAYLPHGCYTNTLSKEWAGSEGWMAMIYYAIDQACNQEGFDGTVYLGTGLPQAMFADLVKTVTAKVEDVHKFEVGHAKYDVEIVPIIIPQAYAAVLSITNEKIDKTMPIGVIDIGTYTTGFSSLENLTYIGRESDGVEIGMHTLYEKLTNYLDKEFKVRITKNDRLEKILKEGVYRQAGKQYSVSEFIETAVDEIVSEILDKALELWEVLEDREIVVAGGGATWMYEAIKKKLPHAVVVIDPFYSVSMGLLNQVKASKESGALVA